VYKTRNIFAHFCAFPVEGVDIFFLDFPYLTLEFGLANKFKDQSREGVFLHLYVFLPGTRFLGLKKRIFFANPNSVVRY
jgi:hypothetical protein